MTRRPSWETGLGILVVGWLILTLVLASLDGSYGAVTVFGSAVTAVLALGLLISLALTEAHPATRMVVLAEEAIVLFYCTATAGIIIRDPGSWGLSQGQSQVSLVLLAAGAVLAAVGLLASDRSRRRRARASDGR